MNIEMCSNAVESHDEPMGASKEGTETFLQQSMIVTRHAARSVFEECRERLSKTRYLNPGGHPNSPSRGHLKIPQ
jgi:hypothetical protein